MDGVITYLNTDLDIISANDLSDLAMALASRGVSQLYQPHRDDHGKWHALYETHDQQTEPELSIAIMLDAVESLDPHLRSTWNQCSLQEYNIGYDSGSEPWSFNQGLSAGLLARIAAAGASLRITIYPERPAAESTTILNDKE